jgi:uncharacterized membrane protein YdbT with pleckstrin-like domain
VEEDTVAATTPPPEDTVWQGSPSQWLNGNTYLLSALAALVLIAAAIYVQASQVPAGVAFLATHKDESTLFLLVLLLVPLFFVVRAYIVTRSIRYQLTTERIITTTGVFSTKTDNLELYRVDDIAVQQPFSLRLLGLANIAATTSDRTTPNMVLVAIPRSQELRDQMRKYVEVCRDRKRTRVLDVDQGIDEYR